MRVGSTIGGLDEYFDANMKGAAAAGLRVGVYYYCSATTVEQATAEAIQVLAWIAPYTVSFPVAIDMEASGQKALSREALANIANTFCGILNGQGYYPLIYSSRNWFRDRIGTVYYDKWIAMYADRLEYDGPYALWQSSSHGQVAGIPGRVDVDHLYRDYFTLIPAEGFRTEGDRTYYFSNYRRRFGWIETAQGRYYAAQDLTIQTGWFTDASGTYYLLPDQGGLAATGFTQIEGLPYYFDAQGMLRTGWLNYSDAGGVVARGLLGLPEGTYYLDPADGHRVTGFVELPDGTRYFDAETGAMLTATTAELEGAECTFDENGILTSRITPEEKAAAEKAAAEAAAAEASNANALIAPPAPAAQ